MCGCGEKSRQIRIWGMLGLAKFKSHALEACANTGAMKRFGGTVQGYDWYGTRVRLVRYNGTTCTVQGYDGYGTRVQLVRYKGTTGTVQGYDWYGARVPLARCKGTTGTAQGYGWHGTRVRLVRCKGTTGALCLRIT